MNPRFCIVRAQQLHKLSQSVDSKVQDGVWEPIGAPFWDKDNLEWCQALYRPDRSARVKKNT